ncbi:uncharacterized protein yc1106_06834 [Curvularia clavata]|uniref:Uncharacterized protein n=1 Tax=Curvularia clavata TaxID=95742 RepID=A0A9Q8ZC82_CURCL|nr:uncharacterized protein yc1106_06834 [Curvularia clavata]
MTDQATSEKPPAKERKPSRLRYEIRLDSTNDDRDSQGNVVQAPHSDTIVFDTQLDISGHATEHMERKDPEPEFTEPPLSPKSRVTLERFAATKKTTIPETDTILFKTFSKELVEPGSKLALLSQTFSYGRAIRTTNPTNTKIGPVEPQPTAHTASPSSTNEEMSNRKAHESIAPGATANRESQETPADTRDGLNITSDGDLTSSMPLPQTLTTDDHLKQPIHPRSGHNLHKSQPLSCMDETTQPLNTVEPVTSQEALHRTSNRGAPSRIVKPRMKSRTESKPTSHGAQEASIPPVVGRALKSLETAFLAESFRKTHEHTTELEHAAEKVTLHLQTIDSQKEVIADLRKQRDELKVAFESLTRKAKTNQKFLEGFQKDYEKLKKLTTTAQEDNRKTLEAKIAEIEEEKHILGRELEITACKLAESQRKIRAVADELYVKLAITLSANESLTKRRDELEEAYKSEKKKCEDAESELLNGIQNLQFQLSNTTNALVNKLDQFQTSVEKTAICDHQDTKIKDCLEILNSLKTEPRLKVHDVRKAEGMLCFMRTRIESGLEELHKAITRNGPHNAEDHASINEQLQDLRTNMMKYEELATENCKIKESNTALTKQLEAQRQQYAHLNEKVEHLKKVEIDLKHRSSKLEHDLGSMRNAAQSSRLEMSAIEQTNRELTQRFKEVESELVAAKAKANDAEESRKNLEKQAAEYKKRYETMAKEKMVEMQNAATAREKLSGEFELKLSEKQQELQSEINRLRAALQAEEAAHQKSNKDLRIANAHIEELRKNANGQEAANNKLKAQISQQQSLMKVMSQEADERASRKQQEARSIAELARDKVSLLENETQTLLSELSKARENEHRMKRVEEALSAEKDRLHQEVRDMHSAIDTKDMEIAQIRTEFVNEHQKAIEQYRNDVEECKRRLAETTTSLKEAEANTKLLEDHYQAKISADQQLAESKLLELETEYHNVLQLVKEQSSPLEWHGPHNKASNPCLSHTGQKLSSTKGQKRVERDNRSIIETSQEQDHRRELSILSHTEGSQAQSEDQDLFALFIGDIDSSIQGQANGDLTANHGCNSIPTSQNLGASPFAQASLKERLVRTATIEPQRQIRSSSGFSSMASDELARIQKELEPDMTSRLHSRNAGSQRLEKPFDDNKPEFSHTDNASVMSSQSYQSQERPKSQANTSSRMFPPHGSAPKQNQSPSQSQVIQTKLPSKHEKLDSMIHNLGHSVSSGKRKLSITQTDSDLVLKRQHGTPSTQPAFSSSGPRRRSPRLSRASGDSSGSQSGRSNYTSSDKAHLSRHQLLQTYATPPKRHSSRVKRNQSRNGTASEDEFNDRFDEELAGLH